MILTGVTSVLFPIWAAMHPRLDHPHQADAVVVLSGDVGGRLPKALDLIRHRVAPTLVIDGVPDLPEAKARCRSSTDFEVICLMPQPDTTHTEARAAGRLARQRGWNRLVVVTDKVHANRARLLFERCAATSIAVVGAYPVPGFEPNWDRIEHEWLGVLQALTTERGC